MLEKQYTIKEAAKETRMSVSWWRQKISNKEIRHLKIGRRVFIPESSLEELFAKAIVEPVQW